MEALSCFGLIATRFFLSILKSLRRRSRGLLVTPHCVSAFGVLAESWKMIAPCSPPRKTTVKHFWADALFKYFVCYHAVRHARKLSCSTRFTRHQLCERASMRASANDLIIGVSPNNITLRRALEFRTWQKGGRKRGMTRKERGGWERKRERKIEGDRHLINGKMRHLRGPISTAHLSTEIVSSSRNAFE